MSPDDIRALNTDPWFWSDLNDTDGSVAFLVRFAGTKEPFGMVVARDRDELFWLIDELTDPYACEVSVAHTGAFFSGITPQISEELETQTEPKFAWRPVDDGTLFPRERAENLSRFKTEVKDLGKLLTDLRRKKNARTGEHRRHP